MDAARFDALALPGAARAQPEDRPVPLDAAQPAPAPPGRPHLEAS